MPPFCIGTAARASATTAPTPGRSTCPRTSPPPAPRAVLEAGVDVAISASMDVDHGTVQPLQKLFGDADGAPVIPIFINSVATPLGPLRRVRALGAAVGTYLATLGKRVLVVGSGGLSHDPPVPTLATAPPPRWTHRARRADDAPSSGGPADRGDGRRARLRARRQPAAATQPGLGSRVPRTASTPTASPTWTAGRTAGSRARRATPRTRSAPGWRRSRRWPRRGAYATGSGTTGPRPS